MLLIFNSLPSFPSVEEPLYEMRQLEAHLDHDQHDDEPLQPGCGIGKGRGGGIETEAQEGEIHDIIASLHRCTTGIICHHFILRTCT